jgi:type VI secretion system protein ImpI
MTLRLFIEHSVHPQTQREMFHPGGEFSIGRGAECNWQLNDPDMYVSRKHCVITGEMGRFIVTDASRGGLFIDGRDTPLGPGNSVGLEQGMRLRLGDIVIKVEIEQPAVAPPARTPVPAQSRIDSDDFFSQPITPPPAVRRPEGLPQPFESGTIDARRTGQGPDKPAPPPLFDDPFSLDQSTPGRPVGGVPNPIPARSDDFGFGSFFDEPAPAKAAAKPATDDWWGMPENTATPERSFAPPDEDAPPSPSAFQPLQPPAEQGSDEPAAHAEIRTRERFTAPLQASAQPLPPPVAPTPSAQVQETQAASDQALRDAFYRGLGLDPITAPGPASADEMEALGQRFRLLVEGLMLMMRTRAKEKQNARVAQTIITNADVNPLKFLASTNEVIAALITPRGAGYLPPDEAINAAFRDLADHQIRTWVAMQSALRRMIDRFDPSAIERELVETGMIQALLAGGRNAKLWQLYNDRYKDIARSAEDRFLGEVGADFRDAYEGNREKTDDK